MYASGTWIVRDGSERDFERLWQATADDAALAFPGVAFRLLRDAEDPRRFVALSGPWRSHEQIAAARARPAFQEALAGMNDIVERADLSTFELVAEVS